MTKLRDPLTIEDALDRAIGDMTIAVASDATGRKPAYLRALSDPDKREQLTVIDAIKLDVAHHEAGGAGAPIYETIGRILKATCATYFSDAAAIGRILPDVIREGAEANIALFAATAPSASDRQLRETLRELQESHSKTGEAIALVLGVIANREAVPP